MLRFLPSLYRWCIQQGLTIIIDGTIIIYEGLERVGTVRCLTIFDRTLLLGFLQGIKFGTKESQSVFGNCDLSLQSFECCL